MWTMCLQEGVAGCPVIDVTRGESLTVGQEVGWEGAVLRCLEPELAGQGDPPDVMRRWDNSFIIGGHRSKWPCVPQLEVPLGHPRDTGYRWLGGRQFLVQTVKADRVLMGDSSTEERRC